MHEFRRIKHTDYGLKLREKQKVKRYYGLTRAPVPAGLPRGRAPRGQHRARRCSTLLERRLDNVAYLLGFASSRATVRQMITHGNLTVNGKRVDVPSALMSVGDVIAPGKRESTRAGVQEVVRGAREARARVALARRHGPRGEGDRASRRAGTSRSRSTSS